MADTRMTKIDETNIDEVEARVEELRNRLEKSIDSYYYPNRLEDRLSGDEHWRVYDEFHRLYWIKENLKKAKETGKDE